VDPEKDHISKGESMVTNVVLAPKRAVFLTKGVW
jgi:hypothetical protein